MWNIRFPDLWAVEKVKNILFLHLFFFVRYIDPLYLMTCTN